MMRWWVAIICAVTLLTPTGALAYFGPGAGLSLLGALWALLAAVATALFFVVAWPIRKALRHRRAAQALDRHSQNSDPMQITPAASTDDKGQ